MGLDYPIALDLGPDGALYVSTPAFGADSDIGGVVRIDLSRNQPMLVAPDIVQMSTCAIPTPEPRPATLGGADVLTEPGVATPIQSAAGNGDTDISSGAAEASNAGGKSATGAFAVEIKDFSFNPKELDVPSGTTVTWTNLDQVAHTATADKGGFNSGNLNPGQSFSFTFDTPGSYVYNCTYHPGMQGTIVVK
jgi:plastocyanin